MTGGGLARGEREREENATCDSPPASREGDLELRRAIDSESAMLARRSALVLLATAVASPALAHPQSAMDSATQKVAAELMAFREAMKAAMLAKDVVRLRSMYTESFTHTHGSGKVDGRDTRIIALLTGEPVIEDAPMTETMVRVHGDSTLFSGRSPILNRAENKLYDFRWLQVYVREGGTWKLAASQATRLGPSAS